MCDKNIILVKKGFPKRT